MKIFQHVVNFFEKLHVSGVETRRSGGCDDDDDDAHKKEASRYDLCPIKSEIYPQLINVCSISITKFFFSSVAQFQLLSTI